MRKLVLLALCLFGMNVGFTQTNCEDFTDVEVWEEELYHGFEDGDTIGVWNDPELSITITEDGDHPVVEVNEFLPGLFGVSVMVNFEMSGMNQIVSVELYGLGYQLDQMGFMVNGSDTYYMNEFVDGSITVDGIIINADNALGFDDFNVYVLTFEGTIDSIGILLFESGIKNICETFISDPKCEDFTLWTPDEYEDGDLAGFWNDLEISISDPGIDPEFGEFSIDLNTTDQGFYGVNSQVDFDMSGDNQTVIAELYGSHFQLDQMGFSMNNSDTYYMDNISTIDVDGITINIDMIEDEGDDWDRYYLTFEGEIDNISILLFDSGIRNICSYIIDDNTDLGLDTFVINNNNTMVYPNPTNGVINILNTTIIESVQVYNIMGSIILSEIVNSNQVILDLSDIDNGLYLIKTNFNNGSESLNKVIKK
jgi:hypothetical protein